MAVSFRYKTPNPPKPPESSGLDDFDSDRKYLSSKKELGLETNEDSVASSISVDPSPDSNPFAKPPSESSSEIASLSKEPEISKGLARLVRFIKAGLQSVDDFEIDPVELKRRKALACYQAGDRVELLLQQKGLQLDKAA